jgi:hypothetical protein
MRAERNTRTASNDADIRLSLVRLGAQNGPQRRPIRAVPRRLSQQPDSVAERREFELAKRLHEQPVSHQTRQVVIKRLPRPAREERPGGCRTQGRRGKEFFNWPSEGRRHVRAHVCGALAASVAGAELNGPGIRGRRSPSFSWRMFAVGGPGHLILIGRLRSEARDYVRAA